MDEAEAAGLLLATGRVHEDAVGGLLYYVRGISLGLGRGGAFTGTLLAGPEGVVLGRRPGHPGDGALPPLFSQVVDAFGRLAPHELDAAVRAERPWRRARSGLAAGEAAAPITDACLATEFGHALETGLDALVELGRMQSLGLPDWASCLRAYLDLGRFEGHPWFDDARSRCLRTDLGLCPVPDMREASLAGSSKAWP